MSTNKRGCLIAIEGLDRTGKTTQCLLLKQTLEKSGSKVIYQKFPDRTTTTGALINAYLTNQSNFSDHAIHLIFSANRWEAVQNIESHLKQGTTVLIDRYSFSGAVYSAAKDLPDLDMEWAWSCEVGLPKPDLVVFLDLSEEKAAERAGYGEERYESTKMQRRVRQLFSTLFERLVPQEILVKKIDAGVRIEEVHHEITSVVSATLQPNQTGIGKLAPLSGHIRVS